MAAELALAAGTAAPVPPCLGSSWRAATASGVNQALFSTSQALICRAAAAARFCICSSRLCVRPEPMTVWPVKGSKTVIDFGSALIRRCAVSSQTLTDRASTDFGFTINGMPG
ncbi:hypothetical protein V8J36_22490 [Frigidibacter sp. MR17.14]|uniref:hypothetical protein n=1 Tax=Frigidibacter sp. MR17.14 TaxID=3126509 RepID=UPI003012EE44